jgi:Zn-dependent M16 (insulinase) family peptidase
MAEDLCCGGFHFTISDIETPLPPNDGFPLVASVDVSCLDSLTADTVSLLTDLMFEPRIDDPRVLQVTLNKLLTSELQKSRTEPLYATRYAQVGLGLVNDTSEKLAGFTFISDLRGIVDSGEFDRVAGALASFFETMMRSATFSATVHCSSQVQADIAVPLVANLVDRMAARGLESPHPIQMPLDLMPGDGIFLELPVTSSECAIAIKCEPFASPEMPMALSILEEVLNDLMWSKLRDDQGVYSFAAYYHEFECVFSVMTSCDPNPEQTPQVFQQTLDEIAEGELEDGSVDRAVVRHFAASDAPRAPQNRGWTPFFRGWTVEVMQRRREIAWAMGKERIVEAAKYLKEREWHKCIVSNRSICEVPEGFVLRQFANLEK